MRAFIITSTCTTATRTHSAHLLPSVQLGTRGTSGGLFRPAPPPAGAALQARARRRAGYFNGDASTEYQTFTEQWQHYRQAYNVAELSLQQGRGLKGIMFWHWAGVDDNAPNGEGSTICAPAASAPN